MRWLNNYCTDSTSNSSDCYFVRDVWDHHLKGITEHGSGEFEEFNRIIRSGDNAGHFLNAKMIWFESTIKEVASYLVFLFFVPLFLSLCSLSLFFHRLSRSLTLQKYDIEFVTHTLCKRHAYNEVGVSLCVIPSTDMWCIVCACVPVRPRRWSKQRHCPSSCYKRFSAHPRRPVCGTCQRAPLRVPTQHSLSIQQDQP